ncbi:MAG: hypothetical protein IMY71_11405 [Bacteroidetes bacterium]|nr:hypothetical protein [Bacteroidota bacterium]
MKKLSLIFIFFSFILIINISGQSYTQSTRLGGGISFGTGCEYHHVHTGNPGIRVIGIHDFTESFKISASFTFFLPEKEDFYDGTRSSTLWMVDLEGQYFLYSHDKFLFYAVGGLSTTGLNSNYKGESPDIYPDYSDQAIGLNLGARANLPYNETMIFFGEIKYVAGKYHQFIVSVGALMTFAKRTE